MRPTATPKAELAQGPGEDAPEELAGLGVQSGTETDLRLRRVTVKDRSA